MAGILFIISAPSGSGKSTLVNQLRSLVSGLEFSVSWTTREPRGSEQAGREYHYTSRRTFEEMVDRNEFLEHADVFGNYYGTPRSALEDAHKNGRDLLLDIDVQGAQQIRQTVPDAVSIFMVPPSPEILAARLRNRSRAEGLLQEEVIERRLAKAHLEIENYAQYSYILVNDVLERTVEEMTAIVLSERVKRGEAQPDQETERLARIAEGCRQQNAVKRILPVLIAFGFKPDAKEPDSTHSAVVSNQR